MPRGRPRTANVPREPNGRRSRRKVDIAGRMHWDGETEREATATAKQARMRLYGLTAEEAGHELYGTLIGRMFRLEEIGYDEHLAAEEWIRTRLAALRAAAAPGLPRIPREGASAPDEDEYAKQCRDRIERYEVAVAVVLEGVEGLRLNDGPRRLEALDAFLLREEYVSGLVRHLKDALVCLHKHWFVDSRRRVA
jgi:hypothetical protein